MTEPVLTCTHNQCFEQNKRNNIKNFHLKMNIFTAVKSHFARVLLSTGKLSARKLTLNLAFNKSFIMACL